MGGVSNPQAPRLWAVFLTRPPGRPKVSRFATSVLALALPEEWGGQETRPTTKVRRRALQQISASPRPRVPASFFCRLWAVSPTRPPRRPKVPSEPTEGLQIPVWRGRSPSTQRGQVQLTERACQRFLLSGKNGAHIEQHVVLFDPAHDMRSADA